MGILGKNQEIWRSMLHIFKKHMKNMKFTGGIWIHLFLQKDGVYFFWNFKEINNHEIIPTAMPKS